MGGTEINLKKLEKKEKRTAIINKLKEGFDLKHNDKNEVIAEGYDAHCRATMCIEVNNVPFFMIGGMKMKLTKSWVSFYFNEKMISYLLLKDIYDFDL